MTINISRKLHKDGEEHEQEIEHIATGSCSIILDTEFWYGNFLRIGLIEDRQIDVRLTLRRT